MHCKRCLWLTKARSLVTKHIVQFLIFHWQQKISIFCIHSPWYLSPSYVDLLLLQFDAFCGRPSLMFDNEEKAQQQLWCQRNLCELNDIKSSNHSSLLAIPLDYSPLPPASTLSWIKSSCSLPENSWNVSRNKIY